MWGRSNVFKISNRTNVSTSKIGKRLTVFNQVVIGTPVPLVAFQFAAILKLETVVDEPKKDWSFLKKSWYITEAFALTLEKPVDNKTFLGNAG